MTDATAVLHVERLQQICAERHMRYVIHNGSVCIQANPAHYTSFAEDNLLWMGQTVEQALAWLTGVFGGSSSQLVARKPFAPKVVV